MKKEFVDHATKAGHIETTAQIVGVERGEAVYRKVRIILIAFFVTSHDNGEIEDKLFSEYNSY